jgi:histidinol dehydrogenase
MAEIRTLSTDDREFDSQLDELLAWDSVSDADVQQVVKQVIGDIRSRGDAALLEYTSRFDGWEPEDMVGMEIPAPRLEQAWNSLPQEKISALQHAADRIRSYAERQKMESWSYTEEDGTVLGQQVSALDRVGLYVPGGKAAYPSSVLMNAIPAKVAGVPEVIMAVPTPGGILNELVLAAAHVSGVDRVFTMGGAQAVAALAYGTQSIPGVDKIVGPGNIYVATAKRAVFGQVGIDMVAGPSEILVICDGKTDPDWVAMDLFSQAEHDENAQSILISPDEDFLQDVQESIERLLPSMEREEIIATALRERGALVLCKDLEQACDLANRIAPEHLELSVDDPQAMAEKIRHAGAIFMGRHTSEPLGDYCAGPNHVLPTSRTARFSSPLGVYDFQKRSSLIMASEQGADTLGRTASVLARGEGLTAHARAAEFRLKDVDEDTP